MTESNTKTWTTICPIEKITPGTGVAALVEDTQVAIFRIGKSDQVRAISNYDPFAKANVISRGIIGSRGDTIKVASPILKHNFCLDTGEYLEDSSISITTYPVRVMEGVIQVQAN